MFKRLLPAIMAMTMCAGVVLGCGSVNTAGSFKNDDKKLNIVTTIFPVYDWTRNITEDNADVAMLLSGSVDMHNYQPSAQDMIKIKNSDLFIYVGGESDDWVEEAIGDSNIKTLNLMNVLGDTLLEEEEKEGMETEPEEEEEGICYDEHIWLSLKNAKTCCEAIEKAVEEADPQNTQIYEENGSKYATLLEQLNAEYETTLEDATGKTVVFGDRFPFLYLFNDYGIDYYAAFKGCSAESEASFETIAFLAEKLDELKLPYVCAIDGSDQKIAQALIASTKDKNQEIKVFDSMQGITEGDVKNGASYIGIMKGNLDVLNEVTGGAR